MRTYHKVDHDKLSAAIDALWIANHCPPSLRDIGAEVGIPHATVVRRAVRKLQDVRIGKRGQVIPGWVDRLFHMDKTTGA
jgi:hypothetical protein